MSIYILSEKKYEGAKNLPCIVIKYINQNIDLTKYDALIFTSKNGVEALHKINKNWINIPSFSIGSATSSAIKKYSKNLVYEAKNSYGDIFAKEIKNLLKGRSVLFLRAKVVTSNLNTILVKNAVLLDECIVYESICNKCTNLKKPEKNSCIIFSSPSTIKCFFKCFPWDESYKAVVIGKVTASYMPKGIDYAFSTNTNIKSCIEKCKEFDLKK